MCKKYCKFLFIWIQLFFITVTVNSQDILLKKNILGFNCNDIVPNGDYLFLGVPDSMEMINTKTLEVEKKISLHTCINMHVSGDGSRIVTGSEAYRLDVWDVKTLDNLYSLQTQLPPYDRYKPLYPLEDTDISHDGKIVWYKDIYEANFIDLNTKQKISIDFLKDRLDYRPQFLQNNAVFIVLYNKEKEEHILFDLTTKKVIKNLEYKGLELESCQAAGNYLLGKNSKGRCLFLVKDRSLELVREYGVADTSDKDFNLSFDGQYLIQAPNPSSPLRFYNIFLGNLLYEFNAIKYQEEENNEFSGVFPLSNEGKMLILRQKNIEVYDISKIKSAIGSAGDAIK